MKSKVMIATDSSKLELYISCFGYRMRKNIRLCLFKIQEVIYITDCRFFMDFFVRSQSANLYVMLFTKQYCVDKVICD